MIKKNACLAMLIHAGNVMALNTMSVISASLGLVLMWMDNANFVTMFRGSTLIAQGCVVNIVVMARGSLSVTNVMMETKKMGMGAQLHVRSSVKQDGIVS